MARWSRPIHLITPKTVRQNTTRALHSHATKAPFLPYAPRTSPSLQHTGSDEHLHPHSGAPRGRAETAARGRGTPKPHSQQEGRERGVQEHTVTNAPCRADKRGGSGLPERRPACSWPRSAGPPHRRLQQGPTAPCAPPTKRRVLPPTPPPRPTQTPCAFSVRPNRRGHQQARSRRHVPVPS